jgi:hypothetical protein
MRRGRTRGSFQEEKCDPIVRSSTDPTLAISMGQSLLFISTLRELPLLHVQAPEAAIRLRQAKRLPGGCRHPQVMCQHFSGHRISLVFSVCS